MSNFIMNFICKKWILSCISVHILFTLSIFDIYFQSPLVDGIPPIANSLNPSAKRLVLIVGDGARSDSCYTIKNNKTAIPHIRTVIENRGRWGVSHTRVPTESRPGHIALIAGFYEDPSAIFKGWKENPIDFDSVFNESRLTFAWGSPDIVPIFSRKNNKKTNYIKFTYTSDLEDFSAKSEIALYSSQWTLEQFHAMIDEARRNETLRKIINQDRIIFFFHLLGIDTSGHSHKPHSEEYFKNILTADQIVKDVEKTINEFFSDSLTSFIFTSDHGMTDWGSHGEGSIEETEVPFVAWGAGILSPKLLEIPDPNTAKDWKLNKILRNDVNQADIAPLISILLGIPVPVNSVGTIPLEILNMTVAEKSKAILLNSHQIINQFVQKKKNIESKILKFLYKPYNTLSGGVNEIMEELNYKFKSGQYDEVINGSLTMITEGLLGLDYYHNYHQNMLLICISVAYIGWIMFLILIVFSEEFEIHNDHKFNKCWNTVLNSLFLLSITITVFLLFVQSFPLQYYLYCCLPLLIWRNVLFKMLTMKTTLFQSKDIWPIILAFLTSAIGTEIMVIGFFDRRALSVLLALIAVWPLSKNNIRKKFKFIIHWLISCALVAIFPFLPIMKSSPNNIYILFAGIIWLIFTLSVWIGLYNFKIPTFHYKHRKSFLVPTIIIITATINVLMVSLNFSNGHQLSLINQLTTWCIFCVAPLVPLIYSKKIFLRLSNIYFCLGALSLLYTLTYEALFTPLFGINLLLWLLIETQETVNDINIKKHTGLQLFYFKPEKQIMVNRRVNANDFRISFFFFFYMILAFFGTGNLASINSFDTGWVRCFITVFAPHTMFALILVKIAIPFVMATCTFRAINVVNNVPIEKLFFIVLIYCELMGLNFLFLVKNVGSWLEIGSSVSHYIISQTIIMFLILLYSLSAIPFFKFKIKHLLSRFAFKRYNKTKYME